MNQIEQLETKVETIRMVISQWKQEITKYETVLPALVEKINQLKKQANNNENMNTKNNQNNTLNGGVNTK